MSLKKILTSKSEKDISFGGKCIPKGSKVVMGIRCPKCSTFYPTATRIERCNTKECGYVSKPEPTRKELKQYIKAVKKRAYKVKEANLTPA